MQNSREIIQAFAEWFEGDGFRPQARYTNEDALRQDLRKQLDSWIQQNFQGWRARVRRVPAYVGPFGYRYRPDIEIVDSEDEYIPIEVKLMKQGWEVNQAIGQAIMYSRIQDEPAAVAAVLDVRSNPAPYGDLEKALKSDLWKKLGVRLCVRKG